MHIIIRIYMVYRSDPNCPTRGDILGFHAAVLYGCSHVLIRLRITLTPTGFLALASGKPPKAIDH